MKERKTIKKMPNKETLEEYMNPEGGVNVSFNIETGEFEWIRPRPIKDSAKTEYGRSLQKDKW